MREQSVKRMMASIRRKSNKYSIVSASRSRVVAIVSVLFLTMLHVKLLAPRKRSRGPAMIIGRKPFNVNKLMPVRGSIG